MLNNLLLLLLKLSLENCLIISEKPAMPSIANMFLQSFLDLLIDYELKNYKLVFYDLAKYLELMMEILY